jgi:hypothetical protein
MLAGISDDDVVDFDAYADVSATVNLDSVGAPDRFTLVNHCSRICLGISGSVKRGTQNRGAPDVSQRVTGLSLGGFREAPLNVSVSDSTMQAQL